MTKSLGYGLIGCGGFGLFCLEQYAALGDLRVVAVADVNPAAAQAAAAQAGAAACTPAELLTRDDVELVHIATPPFTHRDLALQALAHGKHVLCEKPLALTRDDAQVMRAAAQRAGRVLAVNLIMRYDPLCAGVQQITERRLLGEPLHAYFENYAKDESLPPEHWFWERAKSGGIFIEHAVHFFDLFEWWFGPGEVVAAQQSLRASLGAVEQVACTVRYGQTVIANFYHGFTQANRMDRQELRILYEMGSLTLDEWVPTVMHIDALVNAETLQQLTQLLPGARVKPVETYTGEARRVTARHTAREVDGRVNIEYAVGLTKFELYGKIIRELMADQMAAIRDPAHLRRVTEQNGLTSLEYALQADALARGQSS